MSLTFRLRRWKGQFDRRERYATFDRAPFWQLAERYLPQDAETVIVDLGSGDGGFARQLDLARRFRNLCLLDGNPRTVGILANEFSGAALYRAPDPLPFGTGSVGFIHSSHFVEHLHEDALHKLLLEVDRVLSPGGILVISTPVLWEGFYGNLTHVRPYCPDVFFNYLTRASENRSKEPVSVVYEVMEVVERTCRRPFGMRVGASHPFVDFLLAVVKATLYKLTVREYVATGYSLVLRKPASSPSSQ